MKKTYITPTAIIMHGNCSPVLFTASVDGEINGPVGAKRLQLDFDEEEDDEDDYSIL